MSNGNFGAMRNLLKTIAVLCATLGSAQAGLFFEGRYEISGSADLNGDGLQDIIVVDRPTGAFRIGYQGVGGSYTWSDPRGSGADNVDSVSSGRLFQTTRDGLAIASSLANRVNLFDVPNASSPGAPTTVFTPGIGPNFVVAINIPGAGDTAHDDLFVGSSENNAPNNGYYAQMRNNAGASSLIIGGVYPVVGSGNRFALKSGGPEFIGAVARAGANDEIRILNPLAAGPTAVATRTVPRGSLIIPGKFAAGTFNHILSYNRGQQGFNSHLASEPVAGTYALAPGVSNNLGADISQLIVLPGTTADRLMALFNNGTARVYSFDGSAAPTVIQNITPDSGERLTSIVPTGNHDFIAFGGTGNVSQSMRKYTVSGGGYAAGPKLSLPALTPVSGDANIFLFDAEPFVSTQPGLLRSISAGDWTSGFQIVAGAPPTFQASVWNFEGGSLGLRNPTPMNFGPVAATADYGLVNQYASSISLFSRTPAIGDEVVEVKITPEPGEFNTAISVSLSSTLPGAQLWYRLGVAGSWTLYSAPFTLFRTTTVQYYGNPLGSTTKSRIHTGEYVFPNAPATQDSDSDGVPDYVEIGKGLNPNGGKDQDGDGFTDFNELITGTDPLLAASVPTDQQRLEEKAAFDLYLGLQPLDGLSVAPTTAAQGVGVRSYDLYGSILRYAVSSNLGVATITDPGIKQTNIVLSSDPPLIAVGTDPHFDIATASPDKKIGREMLGLIQVPRPPLPQVPYVMGNLSLATEASAWVTSAQLVYASLPREQVKSNLDIYDTLTSLLFERKVSQILLQRGDPSGSNMTFFPFRPGDVTRTNPPPTSIEALELQLDDVHKGYKLGAVQAGLETMVATDTPTGMAALKGVTKEIYRISSMSNNIAPAKYPSPVDVLRSFLETGTLHSNYLAGVIAPIDLVAALNGYNAALSNVTARPTVSMELVVRADTFGGLCTRLDTAVLPAVQKTLIHPGGEQYRLLESFNLLPGSHITVFGYTDVVNPTCLGADAIEVIALALDTVPETTPVDTDGDLLLDALEFLLFGSLSNTAFGDVDGDGFSNIQEILDGTDAGDAGSQGLVVVNLSPPALSIAKNGLGDIILNFSFPASYMEDFHFAVKSTTALGTAFVDEAITPTNIGGNNFQVALPNPGTASKFYQLTMSLN